MDGIIDMTNYTNISKPTNTPYTNLNSMGKEQYDQATLQYDDSGTFYDGVNQSLYTNVLKPTISLGLWNSQTLIWQLMNPWQSTGVATYTNIPKPT